MYFDLCPAPLFVNNGQNVVFERLPSLSFSEGPGYYTRPLGRLMFSWPSQVVRVFCVEKPWFAVGERTCLTPPLILCASTHKCRWAYHVYTLLEQVFWHRQQSVIKCQSYPCLFVTTLTPYHKHVFLPFHRCGVGEIETSQYVVWGIVILLTMFWCIHVQNHLVCYTNLFAIRVSFK